ncbi:MAG: glycosyltransferase family 4 protein, partial [Chloroflexota bacterium]|nr:glycosyltransferase family 4 protein [Chloroflexota bacterium]
RLHVVWNGVDVAAFAGVRRPAHRRALLGLTTPGPLIVAVGRMTPQKRHDILLDAIALARRDVPDLVLAIAGDGPLRPELEARAARLGLTGAPGGQHGVRFLGRYPRVPELLRCVDALVQPSAFEGLPLAVLEGMAAGLPVVVTDTIGTNETVEDERSGLVVPPNSPTALAGAIVRLVRERGLAQRLGAAARRRAQRYFSATMMAGQTQAIYERVLACRPDAIGTDATPRFVQPGALTA